MGPVTRARAQQSAEVAKLMPTAGADTPTSSAPVRASLGGDMVEADAHAGKSLRSTSFPHPQACEASGRLSRRTS